MYNQKKILAVIPARGGSKGLPGKNIRPLLGKPLIAWTIEQALNSKFIDRLIVSTDDEQIAEISKKYGAEVPFLRPSELAQDKTPTIDVLFHLIKTLEEKYDYLLLLEATSPLRKKNDIDNAITKLLENEDKADTLICLVKIEHDTLHPYGVKTIKDNFVVPFITDAPKFTQRQELNDAYAISGGIYISKISTLFEQKTFYHQKTIANILERWQYFEIDYLYDFLCVESIMKNLIETGEI